MATKIWVRLEHGWGSLEAAKLKTLVRGIRPRVDAKASPREGEPTDYVLVLGDIIGVHKSVAKPLRAAFNMYKNGELSKYKSACMCNIVHDVNGSVSLYWDIFKYCFLYWWYKLVLGTNAGPLVLMCTDGTN